MNSGRSLLFVPKLPDSYAIWMGRLSTLQDLKDKYEVEECHYVTEVYLIGVFPGIKITCD